MLFKTCSCAHPGPVVRVSVRTIADRISFCLSDASLMARTYSTPSWSARSFRLSAAKSTLKPSLRGSDPPNCEKVPTVVVSALLSSGRRPMEPLSVFGDDAAMRGDYWHRRLVTCQAASFSSRYLKIEIDIVGNQPHSLHRGR